MNSENSDKTRLILVFAWHTVILLVLSCRDSNDIQEIMKTRVMQMRMIT